ncbi:hypothetical protein BH09PAT3_BH09PAT3_6510 [soil metagenome]
MDENQSEQNVPNNEQPDAPVAVVDKLEDAKKQAMTALAPLIGSLDVDPEKKFEICMNTIRLTNDRELVSTALQAALSIDEENVKAEALVELINEINYLQQNV